MNLIRKIRLLVWGILAKFVSDNLGDVHLDLIERAEYENKNNQPGLKEYEEWLYTCFMPVIKEARKIEGPIYIRPRREDIWENKPKFSIWGLYFGYSRSYIWWREIEWIELGPDFGDKTEYIKKETGLDYPYIPYELYTIMVMYSCSIRDIMKFKKFEIA